MYVSKSVSHPISIQDSNISPRAEVQRYWVRVDLDVIQILTCIVSSSIIKCPCYDIKVKTAVSHTNVHIRDAITAYEI